MSADRSGAAPPNGSPRLRRGSSGLEVNLSGQRAGQVRRRRLRFRRLLILIALFLILVLIGELTVALFRSPRFAIVKVEFIGVTPATWPLVQTRLPQLEGANLFSLPTRRIARQLCTLSFAASAEVQRKPPRAVLITLNERKPVAFSRQPWGVAFLDAGGLTFSRPGAIPKGLPEIQGLVIPSRKSAYKINDTGARALQKGLAAFAQSAKLKLKVLSVDENGWLTATLASGVQLQLGSEDQLSRKLHIAAMALATLGPAHPAEYLDVSSPRNDPNAPEAIIWKPCKDINKRKDGPTPQIGN
jgi:cell division protein FtsQ